MRTSLSCLASLTVVLTSTAALAQNAPRACTATTAAEIATGVRSVPVSASISTDGGLTVWTLYGSGTGSTVTLGQLSGLASNTLSTNAYTLGEGTLSRGALAVLGSSVAAAFQRADNTIDVTLHPIAGGADKHVTFPATQTASTVSIATVGTRALVAWDEGSNGLRFAWVSSDGAGSAVQSLAGAYNAPMVTTAFGGAIVAVESDGHLGVVTVNDTPRFVRMSATEGVSPATGASVSQAGNGLMVLAGAAGRTHLSVVRGASGSGTDRAVGGAGASAETGVSGTQWGGFLAWVDAGQVTFLPVNKRGNDIGASFAISSGETARTPAVTSAGNMAVTVWTAGSSLKFVRVTCL